MPPPFFIQVSDTHLFEDASTKLWDVAPDQALDTAVEALSGLDGKPSFILVTGDCSADGSEASYLRLAGKLQRLGAPVYYIPGNHDDAQRMARLLAGRAINPGDKLTQDFDAAGWRFILLDSSVPDQDWGALGKDQIEWLRGALAQRQDVPTMVVVHHNPLPIGSAWLDTMTIADADQLVPLIDAAPQVRAVLFGHIHQETNEERGSTKYLSVPSTFFQFKPHSATFAEDKVPAGARIVHLEPSSFSTAVMRFGQSLPPLS
ncbi:MAG: phosphodiesterase [Candidatus Eremiobacteraeota bacterium]|nr:phosphodiesterase [Candidatus Eremiobacteraeota bacterium]